MNILFFDEIKDVMVKNNFNPGPIFPNFWL